METEQSYCLCGSQYDPNVFMIQCDVCRDWFHSSCTQFQEQTAPEIDKYHCPRCSPMYGPSQYKTLKNFHRHDYWDEEAGPKPVQTGTATFIKELRARHFHNEEDIVMHVKGHLLNANYLMQNGFSKPIVVSNREGLDMVLPPSDFSLYDVENYVGGEHEMDVIDVVRQSDLKMKLKDFVTYFYSLNRTKVYNVVSLEFSKTGLSKLVEAPLAARQLDWANVIWPKEYAYDQLCVQKYCLMSVKDSYTDFHIDFGGTSVWYHVLRGQKIFYLIKPTPANLTLYQQWMTSSNQSETFFGDQADQCFKCVLKAGQTMMIPTGWIHAVLTPEDSLVFGGNYLHSLNIPMQLQVYDIEKKIKTAAKFLYPFFETIHWFAAQQMLMQIQKINIEGGICPDVVLSGLKTLMTYLKSWNTDKDLNQTSKEQIPMGINVAKMFKDISKEVRTAERYNNTLNPPKPERESQRKRKRPVNKDFIEFSLRKSPLDIMMKSEVLPVKTPKKATPAKTKIKVPVLKPPEKNMNIIPMQQPFREEPSWPVRPETATAVHRGGTVLKIKLGTKDILPVVEIPQENKIIEHLPPHKSIYDFKDDDSLDESMHLFIDENPQRKPAKKSLDWQAKIIVEDENPANGIESLLKASALTTKFIDRNEEGRTSPSTQEAIAGMIAIGQTFVQPKKSNKNRKRLAENLMEDEEIHDVHQDDNYIYPAIEQADEELYKPKGRSGMDESWNPKARVGPLLPKMNRPAREGTKKEAVEKVLKAAAKSSASSGNKSVKKVNRKKKPKIPKAITDKPAVTNIAVVPGPSINQSPATKSVAISPGPSKTSRKGMKTVKQRLGKILKIHKMMH